MALGPRAGALLTVVLLAAPAAAMSFTAATVGLSLHVGSRLAPAYRECLVWLDEGASAGRMLDAAVDAGCISSWEYDGVVRCIDDLCDGAGWHLYLNGLRQIPSPWRVATHDGDLATYVIVDVGPPST